jgi:N-acylneuraminate cytidylyltransferase
MSVQGLGRVLGLIPARGGSKGLPGKNLKLLAGVPLIAHSIACARSAIRLTRTVVSTDSAEIARVARHHGGDVPFIRPAHLATDDAPMWGVVRHALETMDAMEGKDFDAVVLLDPTNPCRTPEEIDHAIETLAFDVRCDGVIGVIEPEANPIWHSVIEDDGYLRDLIDGSGVYTRRQDVPHVYSINGALYVWRREAVFGSENWRNLRLRKQLVSDVPFTPVDSQAQFDGLTALVQAGVVILSPSVDGPR